MIQHATGKEIPIPGIIRIPTYGTDYLPVRRERNTYIRPKGGWMSAPLLPPLTHIAVLPCLATIGFTAGAAGGAALLVVCMKRARLRLLHRLFPSACMHAVPASSFTASSLRPDMCTACTAATHVCTAGGVGYEDPILVEYDLDAEDEAWLKKYNGNEVSRM
jgi:hypothetical protein